MLLQKRKNKVHDLSSSMNEEQAKAKKVVTIVREKEPSLLDDDVFEKRFTHILSNYVFKEAFIFDVI